MDSRVIEGKRVEPLKMDGKYYETPTVAVTYNAWQCKDCKFKAHQSRIKSEHEALETFHKNKKEKNDNKYNNADNERRDGDGADEVIIDGGTDNRHARKNDNNNTSQKTNDKVNARIKKLEQQNEGLVKKVQDLENIVNLLVAAAGVEGLPVPPPRPKVKTKKDTNNEKKDCKYGNQCTRKHCKFNHPDGILKVAD
jgi:hypothetical protein